MCCDKVKEAYQRYLIEREKNDNYSKENNFLKEFEEFILNWDGTSDIPDKYTMIDNPKFLAGIGLGVVYRQTYAEFINDESTKEIIKIMRDKKLEYKSGNFRRFQLVRKVMDCGLYENINKVVSGSKPKAYVNKFMLVMFPEFCTAIANDGDLVKAAQVLDINYRDIPTIPLQYNIRSKIDDCLKEMGVYNEIGLFDRMVIAWFLVE